jgi:preprotein translocase subunit SecF
MAAALNLDFMRYRKVAFAATSLAALASIVSFALQGFSLGLDFSGGTMVEVTMPSPVAPAEVRGWLAEAGFGDAVVQSFGSERDLLLRVPPQQAGGGDVTAPVVDALRGRVGDGLLVRQSEFVGPAAGEQLREDGGLAMIVACALVMLYVLFRFSGKFAVAALVALLHDLVITAGFFSIFRWTFDLPVLAALLAVVGYSLNDTIVICDRIRENFRGMRRASPVEVINASLNQVLERTLITGVTTLLVLVTLAVFGGEQLRGFSVALILGIVVGTYSSIYVVASLLLTTGVVREDLLVPAKEGLEDGRP